MAEVQSHLVLWSKARAFKSTQMSTWNDSLQAEHSIMVQSDLLGIRHVQKTGTFTVDFIFFSFLRHFLIGKGSAFSASRHLIRWGHICSWSKTKLPGFLHWLVLQLMPERTVHTPQFHSETPCRCTYMRKRTHKRLFLKWNDSSNSPQSWALERSGQ